MITQLVRKAHLMSRLPSKRRTVLQSRLKGRKLSQSNPLEVQPTEESHCTPDPLDERSTEEGGDVVIAVCDEVHLRLAVDNGLGFKQALDDASMSECLLLFLLGSINRYR